MIKKVAVVCAWFNRENYINETLLSLINQEYINYEIIIINDGSTDSGVKNILENYKSENVEIFNQENTGFTAAISRAIAYTECEYIAIQGAGDLSVPERLKYQSEFLDNNPKYAMIGSSAKTSLVDINGKVINVAHDVKSSFEVSQHYLEQVGNPFCHGAVMFRREAYLSVGGYRRSFKFAQDKDLWLRMSTAYKLYHDSTILYERRIFKKDGVAGNPISTVLQLAFSQHAIDLSTTGQEYCKIFGEECILFRKRNKKVSKKLSRTALKLYLDNDNNKAETLARLALMEKVCIDSVIAWSIVCIGKPISFRRMIKLLKRLS